MEIIKDHEKEITEKINNYEIKRDDYLIILLSSGLLLCFLGIMFIFSFFVGSYIMFILAFAAFSISLVLFGLNTYKIILNREEVKRLKLIKEDKNIYDDNELKDILIDSFKYIKNYFYGIILKVINILEKEEFYRTLN